MKSLDPLMNGIVPDGKVKGWRLRRALKKLNGTDIKHCGYCGSTENLTIHHKDGNSSNNQLANLLVLCRTCHMYEHKFGLEKVET